MINSGSFMARAKGSWVEKEKIGKVDKEKEERKKKWDKRSMTRREKGKREPGERRKKKN